MNKIFSAIGASKRQIYSIGGLLLVALLVALITPDTKGFQYQYSKGKPWQHELLTAPYDFPIYKTETEINLERDSVEQEMKPIFTKDPEVENMMISELKEEYKNNLISQVPKVYLDYAEAKLKEIYNSGLVQGEEFDRLRKEEKLEIQILGENNVLRNEPITKFYTLKEGYDKILKERPATINQEILQRMDLTRFISDNVMYDEGVTKQVLAEKLSNLSLSIGMVQQGERIIDRGEIVTPVIYNLLRSLSIEQDRRSGGALHQRGIHIGVFLVLSLLFIVAALYLRRLVPSFNPGRKNALLLVISGLIFLILTVINSRYDLINIYIIPYVMLVILLRIFLDSYTSFLTFTTVVLASAIFVPEPLPFILIQMLSGMSALISLQKLNSRGQMIRAAFIVYIAYTISSIGVAFVTDGSINSEHWMLQLYFAINLIFLTFTYILAFFVERIFGYVSNVSLVELSDVNTPLLRELSEVAPGTFQHSLQVSILASEAAAKIGAGVQLVRTGALYHDIGKIKNPAYFTENQGSNNPHDLLPNVESAHIIIRHVTDGIVLAQKHNLPTQIIDFIRTHHGRSMTRYFYIKECNEHPDLEISPEPFTYIGPNPWTKEQGILLLADSVEASSRSLKEYTDQTITQHIDHIVDAIVSEGLLNDTPITFRDIQQIKAIFASKLKTMYHTRISYPDKK